MHIYKWTHKKTGKASGRKWSEEQKQKLKPVQERLKMLKNKTWKVVDGKRVLMEKE